ncbi:MAG: hypothetical protein ABW065_05895 [Solirubrobacterales bacterium]
MRFKATLVAALAAVLVFAAAASAAMVGIYRNGMDTTAQRGQLLKLSGKDCARGGSESALRITLGKATPECSYRTPVIGRNMEIGATERLLSTTPKPSQHGAYLGLALRAGGNARFELRVFPLQRKVQLLKIVSSEITYLAIDKNEKAVMGLNKANALRLRVVNGSEKGKVQVSGYLGNSAVVEATDENGGASLPGQFGGVVLGALKGPNGVVASYDDVLVRVPVRF